MISDQKTSRTRRLSALDRPLGTGTVARIDNEEKRLAEQRFASARFKGVAAFHPGTRAKEILRSRNGNVTIIIVRLLQTDQARSSEDAQKIVGEMGSLTCKPAPRPQLNASSSEVHTGDCVDTVEPLSQANP